MSVTQNAPASMYRTKEDLGVWEHRGKVAAVGIGHSPTARRWDGSPDTSIGALAIDAIRKAIADAGVSPDQVDGLVLDGGTTTGAHWEAGDPVPMDVVNAWNPTSDPLDGIAQLSAEWILKNMPELTNVNFTMYGPVCMSNTIVTAAQAVGDGLTNTCIVLKGWHNLPGRYYQGGANALDTRPGLAAISGLWGGPASYGTALQFAAYCSKYGKNHDMMAPFVVQSKELGLLFPEGFFAQHRPEAITTEDYLSARWIAKPANLYDNDSKRLNLLFDANKMLVARYETMDWDGDGIIDGSNDSNLSHKEEGFFDPWYKALYTSWLDDWYLGGDIDLASGARFF